MRILWFNWRDLKHPDAGGAEVYTHEIMTRLHKKGHYVTMFTSQVVGQPEHERVDGIDIIRRGGKFTLYQKAKHFCKSLHSDYDLIVDEINARPFINAKVANGIPMLALFHQLIKEEWFYETRFPINYLCYYILENRWLSCHKNTPTITVSNSSMQDLLRLGFTRVNVVPNGLNITPLSKLSDKELRPTLVYIGRLKKHKLPDHALKAFQFIKEKIPSAQFWVIGDGNMKESLESGKPENVTFFGRVSDQRKYDLLKRAHLVLMPSVREGWGLVVTESNAMGTPVVGYDVPGLKDSIVHLQTGLLSRFNSPFELAANATALLRDKRALQRYSEAALEHSLQFDWETSADEFARIVEDVVGTPRSLEPNLKTGPC